MDRNHRAGGWVSEQTKARGGSCHPENTGHELSEAGCGWAEVPGCWGSGPFRPGLPSPLPHTWRRCLSGPEQRTRDSHVDEKATAA